MEELSKNPEPTEVVQEQPVEQSIEEAPQEQQVETPAPEQTEEVAPEQVPEQTNEVQETEEEELELPTYNQFQNTQQQQPIVDVNNLPVDQEGNVDPNAFAQAIYQQAVSAANAQAQQTVAEQLREQRLWQQAEKAYPDLATNKDLKSMVHNARLGEMATSLGEKNPSPKQVADRLFKQINTAKASGVEQATNNVRVQQSATLESASNTAPKHDPSIAEAAMSGDADARRQYLTSLIDSGDIRID